ncbi:MAG: hypothetical protein H6Q04_1924 [Acidobacteria bacterium]|nr:hypothetical protein [Acidobacteriota bacterium]
MANLSPATMGSCATSGQFAKKCMRRFEHGFAKLPHRFLYTFVWKAEASGIAVLERLRRAPRRFLIKWMPW